jgi:hypothetical protein
MTLNEFPQNYLNRVLDITCYYIVAYRSLQCRPQDAQDQDKQDGGIRHKTSAQSKVA